MDIIDYSREVRVPNNSRMANKYSSSTVTILKPGKVRHVEKRSAEELTNAEFLRLRKIRVKNRKLA